MRIGTEESYLSLEKTPDPDFPYFDIAARIEERRGVFTGSNDGVLFGGGPEGQRALKTFHELNTHEVSLDFTEGCWIKIIRQVRGNLVVEFQISVIVAGVASALKGVLEVDGEYGQVTSSELCRLLAEPDA